MAENSKCFIVLVIVGALVIMTIALIASSLKKLSSHEVGLEYDTIWKKLGDQPKNEGLHAGAPGFRFIKFPSVFSSLDYTTTCLNKDGVSIVLSVSFQYRARPNDLYDIITQFEDHDGYESVLRSAGSASIHEACSLFNTSQFQSERGKFQEEVGGKLVTRFDQLKCDVSEIQVSNIERPSGYETAVKEKEAARQNIQVAENERPRQVLQAETRRREAETQAQITIAQAESAARIKLSRARAEADAILDAFAKESDTYEELLSSSGLGLSKEGFLSYMGIRAISNAQNPVYVGMDSPAKTSYVT